jgi:hypothetical protein
MSTSFNVPYERMGDSDLSQRLLSSPAFGSQRQSEPTTEKIGPPKEKLFKEFLKSMIEANIAFGLDSTNEKLSEFNKIFDFSDRKDVTDDITSIKEEIDNKMSKSKKSSESSEGKLVSSFPSSAASGSAAAATSAAEGSSRSIGGGKRRRSIKRKHRSIRYNTLRSKK